MILFVAFLGILFIVFIIMSLMMNPSEGQRAVEKRIDDIRSTGNAAPGTTNSQLSQLLKTETVSNFSWLEHFLQQYQISQKLETHISQANSKTSVATLLVSTIGLGLAGTAISYFFVPIVLVQILIGCVCAYIPYGLLSFKRARRIGAFNNALPDSIDMIARALRAGHSVVSALSIVAEQGVEPLKSEFGEVFKQQNFGLPLRDALMQMVDRVPSQDLRVLVTGILVQRETGGNLAEILDRTGHVIRERMRIHGEIKTHTAQGRMTGWILCALPIVMLLLINFTNPGYSKVLLETPTGHKLIYGGLALLTIGAFIIRQIVNGIEV
jgi:tight adherence protein B